MKILICDDEMHYAEDLQTQVSEYMKNCMINFRITLVADPQEILCGDLRYDLAFLDIQMIGMDGITLAKKLKNANGVICSK